VTLALVCCLAPAALASAGEDEAQTEAGASVGEWVARITPGEHHEALEYFAGTWDCEVRMWDSADQTEPLVTKGTSELSWILGGRYLQQDFESTFMGVPFNGLGFIGYDNVAGHYVSVWMDEMGTGIMRETGDVDETGKVYTFHGSYHDAMTGQLTETRTVHTIESPDRHLMVMYHLSPGDELKAMEIIYTRS
jgi:hypothetical protein